MGKPGPPRGSSKSQKAPLKLLPAQESQKETRGPQVSTTGEAQTLPSNGLPDAPSPGPVPLTLGDVFEFQALVPSGPGEVEELAGPTQAPAVRLLIGYSPPQGTGCVVEEVDAQLQVRLPGGQRRAEHGQLQPLPGFPAHSCLQHTGVEAAGRDGDRDRAQWGKGGWETSPPATGLPPHQGPLCGLPRRRGEHSRACREELGWRGRLGGRDVSHGTVTVPGSGEEPAWERKTLGSGPPCMALLWSVGGKETGRQGDLRP